MAAGARGGDGVKLWVDDEREPPDTSWVVARSYEAAMDVLGACVVGRVSLDHDLGDPAHDGYDVVKVLEARAACGSYVPVQIECHSQNPVGRKRIEAAIESLNKARRGVTTTSSTSGNTVVYRVS